ncbi:hypothetical protein ES702_00415 [subsurface metagenome]
MQVVSRCCLVRGIEAIVFHDRPCIAPSAQEISQDTTCIEEYGRRPLDIHSFALNQLSVDNFTRNLSIRQASYELSLAAVFLRVLNRRWKYKMLRLKALYECYRYVRK